MSVSDKVKEKLRERLSALPNLPGVYLFKNKKKQIIYVGKAKSLRHRVLSYFSSGDDGRAQYQQLVAAIDDFEIILTRDEVEALTTEANLIRLYRPRYNVDLRDDRTFPFLQITRETFPRVFLTRKPDKKRADCYGPFTDVRATRHLLRTLTGILHIRTCKLPLTPQKIKEEKFNLCLDYHINRCEGPCVGFVDREQYRKGLDRFVLFLKGHHEEILEQLELEMLELSSELKFEEAAVIRDKLRASKQFSDRQRRIGEKPINRDIIGIAREDHYAAFSVIRVRNGRIVGQSPFYMDRTSGMSDGDLIEAFIVRHYDLIDEIPSEICLPVAPTDIESLAIYIHRQAQKRVQLLVPQRGEKRKFIDLAIVNAEQMLLEQRIMAEKRDFTPRAVKSMQEDLRLPTSPLLIEAFDISNLHGSDSVASLVSFRKGKPWKSGYRIFKIKSVEGIDDFASIGEAVSRRYSRLKKDIAKDKDDESEKFTFPDLILIDGGKGQLSSAKRAMDELNLSDIPVIGLAKRLEEIYFPGHSDPMTLPKRSSSLRLLQQIRDEAHRFAVTQHRNLRGKRQIRSKLDGITGIGPVKKQALLRKFGSLKRIAAAEASEIAKIRGMNQKLAESVKNKLNE